MGSLYYGSDTLTASDTLWTTSASDTVYTINYDNNWVSGLSLAPPKPKTNLDWLNNRVDEMRVKL